MRVLKTVTWLYGWACFALMTAALILILGAGNFVRSDGIRVEWARWVGFIVAGTLVAITVMYYYQFERFPDIALMSVVVAFFWAFGVFLVLTGDVQLCALFSVLAAFMLFVFGFCLYIQSRIMWERLWDFFPAGFYILFSILIWVFLWLGREAGQVISRSWTVVGYIIIWFFLIMGIAVVMWLFYRDTKFDLSVSSAVASENPAMNMDTAKTAFMRQQDFARPAPVLWAPASSNSPGQFVASPLQQQQQHQPSVQSKYEYL